MYNKITVLVVICISVIFLNSCASTQKLENIPHNDKITRLPLEQTIAWELLELELKYVADDAVKKQLLETVLRDAIHALGPNPKQPDTESEVINTSEKIAKVFAEKNFLQPQREADWPDTLGEAFTPKNLSPDSLNDILSYRRNNTEGVQNKKRRDYIDLNKDIFFVDCDMAALLYMSIGQHLGWDIRLVEVPKHNFVRWHLPNGKKVNWDWTRWGSETDGEYYDGYNSSWNPFFASAVKQGIYLRSYDLAEARAYFLTLITSDIKNNLEKKREFINETIIAGANLPIVQNNYAWQIAISETSTREERLMALSYAMRSWSSDPWDEGVADTVACLLSTFKQLDLAIAIEDFALKNANGTSNESFKVNKKLMLEGKLCQ